MTQASICCRSSPQVISGSREGGAFRPLEISGDCQRVAPHPPCGELRHSNPPRDSRQSGGLPVVIALCLDRLRILPHGVRNATRLDAEHLVILLLCCLLAISGCTGAGATGETSQLLRLSRGSIELGVILQGDHGQDTFSLMNRGTHPVEVVKIETSCDCLQIEPGHFRVEPGKQVLVTAIMDLSSEPTFAGQLAVGAKGFGPTGETAFEFEVNADVRVDAAFSALADQARPRAPKVPEPQPMPSD